MATVWDTLRRRAVRRYGLAPGAEDPLLNDPLYLDRVNELLQEAAETTRAFRESFTYNLASPTVLSNRILQVIEGTVRADLDGSGQYLTDLDRGDEQELRRVFGPLETVAASSPMFWHITRGDLADGELNLQLTPRPSQTVTNGLQLQAYVYPLPIVNLSDTMPLQVGEERHLLPGLCYALAQTEASRGRRDAPLAYWQAEWDRALAAWTDAVEDTLHGDFRRIHVVMDRFAEP